MDYSQKDICLLLSETEMFLKVKYILKSRYTLIRSTTIDRAINTIRQQDVNCVLAHVDGHYETTPKRLSRLKIFFPTIPIIGIFEGADLEIARKCGEAGVDCLLSDYDFKILCRVIQQTILERKFKINWSEFLINIEDCSHMMKNALYILKDNYLQLNSVREIAHELDIAPETLSREFKKYCPFGPKRILTLLKIQHAIHLFQNHGLSLKEISTLVGFSNKRRFSESFYKLLQIYPEDLRDNDIHMNTNWPYNLK